MFISFFPICVAREASLDRLDVHILRALLQGHPIQPFRRDVKVSHRGLARNLSVSEGTIRNRIGKMVSSGILSGSSVMVNPSLLGLCMGAYGLDVSPSLRKQDIIDRLKLIDGVFGIQDHHGTHLGILFLYEEADLQKRVSLFLKSSEGSEGNFGQFVFPPCTSTLSRGDWKLLARLSIGPFRNYGQLSRELGVSVRTLKEKISRMLNSNIIFTLPIISLKAIKNSVPADLEVTFDRTAKAQPNILQLVEDYAFYIGMSMSGFLLCDLILPNAATATEILDKVKKTHGVSNARMEFVDEHHSQHEVFAKYLQRHIAIMMSSDASK